jgi:hypothetical protein
LARSRKLVVLATAGAIVIVAIETVLIVALLPSPMEWYVLGMLHTAVAASLAYLLNSAFLAHDREAILHLRGAWGEENTRSELNRARRKRIIWGWVDSVTLENGDIDHLVVTCAGGLIAIDSKWRNRTDVADREAMARAAQKTRLRAEGLLNTLLRREPGTHRAKTGAPRVTPLLVVWGAEQHAIPAGADVDGIEVVGGRQLITWLEHRHGDAIDEAAAREVLARLKDFRASAWIAEN